MTLLFRYLRRNVFCATLAVVLMLLYTLFTMIQPWLNMVVYSKLIVTYDTSLLMQVLYVLSSVALLTVIADYIISLAVVHIRVDILRDMRSDITQKLVHYQYAYFSEKEAGDTIQRIVWEIDNLSIVFGSFLKACAFILQYFLLFMIVIVVDLYTGIICFFLSLSYLLWHLFSKNFLMKSSENLQENMGELYGSFYQNLSSAIFIKIHSLGKSKVDALEEKLSLIKVEAVKTAVSEFLMGISKHFGTLAYIAVLLATYHGIVKGEKSIGGFLAFSGLVFLFAHPVQQFVVAAVLFQKGKVSIKRIEAILSDKSEIDGTLSLEHFHNNISFNKVRFSYGPAEESLFDNFSLTISKGANIALVGGSGSGKSTAVNLLLRLFDPLGGSITIDGIDHRNFSLKSLRHQIGYVSQKSYLFNDTLKNNVDPFDRFSTEAIKEELSKYKLDHLFDRLDVSVGERGSNLSGGEAQRLALMRVLLRDVSILILDEVTSHVDAHTESIILETIERLRKEKPDLTVITISHRVSNLIGKDRVYLLKNGLIAKSGTHEELLQCSGEYVQLFSQNSGEYA